MEYDVKREEYRHEGCVDANGLLVEVFDSNDDMVLAINQRTYDEERDGDNGECLYRWTGDTDASPGTIHEYWTDENVCWLRTELFDRKALEETYPLTSFLPQSEAEDVITQVTDEF